MMVDDVVALLRPQHDRYHVMADERADLLRLLLSQAFAFFLDLAHADSDLGGTQAFDRDGLSQRAPAREPRASSQAPPPSRSRSRSRIRSRSSDLDRGHRRRPPWASG